MARASARRRPALPADALLKDVAVRVRAARKGRGWSRRALAGASGLSERFIAQIESGHGNPSVRSLAEIARALATSPAALLAERTQLVALLGLRGAGKSTVGRALAKRLGCAFVELDARVEEAAGLSLRELWELHGEAYFRQLERETLRKLLASSPRAVLATGGGLVADPATFQLLRDGALTVWLRARPEDHWERVVAQGDHRPMANDPLAMERLRQLLVEREPLYRQARFVVDTSAGPLGAVVDEIEQLVTV